MWRNKLQPISPGLGASARGALPGAHSAPPGAALPSRGPNAERNLHRSHVGWAGRNPESTERGAAV